MYQKSKRLCQTTPLPCENPQYICKVFVGQIKENTGKIQERGEEKRFKAMFAKQKKIHH